MEKRTRAALYARVSTGKQAEKDLSIPAQIKELGGYCKRKGWEIDKVYKEEGASARDDNRPVFKRMIADALDKNRSFDVILTLTTSRFFRDSFMAQGYKRRLSKLGVKVVAAQQEVPDDPKSFFIEGIYELVDQLDSVTISTNTLRAMKENAEQGYYNGSKPKFGFMAVREDGKGQG